MVVENICKVGGIAGSAIATGSSSFLAEVSKSVPADGFVTILTTSGLGAALAWICIRHILQESRRQADIIKAKDRKIEELNKLIYKDKATQKYGK